jgi:hypothetical protein
MIEIDLENNGFSTSRPYVKIRLSDDENFINYKEFDALIDTGADISFINAKNLNGFSFFRQTESREGREQQFYRGFIKIENLVNVHRQLFGSRINKNENPNDKEPDILLGRDFLKNVKLIYYGNLNKIQIEWINE